MAENRISWKILSKLYFIEDESTIKGMADRIAPASGHVLNEIRKAVKLGIIEESGKTTINNVEYKTYKVNRKKLLEYWKQYEESLIAYLIIHSEVQRSKFGIMTDVIFSVDEIKNGEKIIENLKKQKKKLKWI